MKKDFRKSFLLTKRDIFESLGYTSMTMVYKKILTKEILQELGFDSVKEFKNIKIFTLEQSRTIRIFLEEISNQSENNKGL